MEIILRSSVDLGTTNQQEAGKEEKLSDKEEEENFHVLIVDDNHLQRKVLEKLLVKVSSYKVTCVNSGDEALRYLGLLVDDDVDTNSDSSSNLSQKGSKVNLIMTDYCMPGMSGYDLLKRVKGSSWKDVPVVIMSSENFPSRISKCMKEGAEEFLLKPVQLSDLKNLENYLLKPLIGHFCETNIVSDNNKNDDDDDDSLGTKNDKDVIGVVESNSNNNNNIKRKAVMSPSPSQRRPNSNQVKGLAVLPCEG